MFCVGAAGTTPPGIVGYPTATTTTLLIATTISGSVYRIRIISWLLAFKDAGTVKYHTTGHESQFILKIGCHPEKFPWASSEATASSRKFIQDLHQIKSLAFNLLIKDVSCWRFWIIFFRPKTPENFQNDICSVVSDSGPVVCVILTGSLEMKRFLGPSLHYVSHTMTAFAVGNTPRRCGEVYPGRFEPVTPSANEGSMNELIWTCKAFCHEYCEGEPPLLKVSARS